jgi:hypothetical protein
MWAPAEACYIPEMAEGPKKPADVPSGTGSEPELAPNATDGPGAVVASKTEGGGLDALSKAFESESVDSWVKVDDFSTHERVWNPDSGVWTDLGEPSVPDPSLVETDLPPTERMYSSIGESTPDATNSFAFPHWTEEALPPDPTPLPPLAPRSHVPRAVATAALLLLSLAVLWAALV